MSSATKTRIKEVAVLNQVVDVADFLNLLSLRLSPWFKIRILNVTPWSVSFSIAGFDVFASNETGWKVQVIHDQPGTNGSSARHFTEHLNGVLSGGVRDDAGNLQIHSGHVADADKMVGRSKPWELKVGDKVWVKCEVVDPLVGKLFKVAYASGCVECATFFVAQNDCKPVEPDHIPDAKKMVEPETNNCQGNVCDLVRSTGIACPHDSCDIETGVRNPVIKQSLTTESNSPEKLESSKSIDNIPNGWAALLLDEPRLASDAYWSLGAKDWIIIGDSRLETANRDKWPAIRFGNPSKSSNSWIPQVESPGGFKVGDHVREVDDSSGYAYLDIGVVEDIGNIEDFPIGVRYGKRFYAAYKPEQLEKLPQFSKYQRVKVVNKHFVHSGRIGVVDSTSSDGMVHIRFSPSETGLYEPCDIVAVD